jgi:hypothetical protein
MTGCRPADDRDVIVDTLRLDGGASRSCGPADEELPGYPIEDRRAIATVR